MRSPRLLAVLAAVVAGALAVALMAFLLPSSNATATPDSSSADSADVSADSADAVVTDFQTSVAVRATDRRPSQDWESMPKQCASRKDQVPQDPIICPLNQFKEDRPTIVIWGDSHAWMFIPALRQAAIGRDVNLVASIMGSCPPMDNNYNGAEKAPKCVKSNDLGLKFVLKLNRGDQPLRVLLGGSWQRYLHASLSRHPERFGYVGFISKYFKEGTPRVFKTLGRAGVPTDVIGQVSTVPAERKKCSKGNHPFSCNLPSREALPQFKFTRHWLDQKMAPLPGDDGQISVVPYLCSAEKCHGIVDGVHTWFDDFHLSATMSRTLAPYLDRTVQRADTAFPSPTCPMDELC